MSEIKEIFICFLKLVCKVMSFKTFSHLSCPYVTFPISLLNHSPLSPLTVPSLIVHSLPKQLFKGILFNGLPPTPQCWCGLFLPINC